MIQYWVPNIAYLIDLLPIIWKYLRFIMRTKYRTLKLVGRLTEAPHTEGACRTIQRNSRDVVVVGSECCLCNGTPSRSLLFVLSVVSGSPLFHFFSDFPEFIAAFHFARIFLQLRESFPHISHFVS